MFSGIEAATVAWEPLGFEAAAFAEVDPFPSAVLKERYPHVPNLGDITKIDWSGYHGKIDIVVGGSPCQSFSIAGKREGLAGASGLMYEYIRAVREIMPRYFVWENVQGALSSEKGEAFRQLLAEMDGLGYGLAWRILDAQFFGVAQRRRRVFLVGSLGGMRAAEVLFEPDCLQWDTESSREKRKSLAASAQGGVGGGRVRGETLTFDTTQVTSRQNRSNPQWGDACHTLSAGGDAPTAVINSLPAYTLQVKCGCEGGGKGALVQEDVSATLSTSNMQTLFQPASCKKNGGAASGAHMDPNGSGPQDLCGCLAVFENHPQDSRVNGPLDVAPTVHAKYGTGGGNVPLVTSSPANRNVVCMASGQANAEIELDMAPAQAARQYKDPQIVCFNSGNTNDVAHIGQAQSQVAPSLRASRSGTNGTPVVCMADDNAKASVDFDLCGSLKVGGSAPIAACTTQYGSELAGTLTARADSSPCHDRGANVVSDGYVVRRLTPRECERLQGFPDDWTRIAYRGKAAENCPDAPRYKALGNSMAVPVMRWIGERILRVERLESVAPRNLEDRGGVMIERKPT